MTAPSFPRLAFATHALLALGLLMGAPACAEEAEPETPDQEVEPGLPDRVPDTLLDAAGITGHDLEVADYSIYSLEEGSPEATRELPNGCPVRSADGDGEMETVDSLCGVCMCDGMGNVYCIDYLCGDEERSTSELDLALPPGEPPPPPPEPGDDEKFFHEMGIALPPGTPPPPPEPGDDEKFFHEMSVALPPGTPPPPPPPEPGFDEKAFHELDVGLPPIDPSPPEPEDDEKAFGGDEFRDLELDIAPGESCEARTSWVNDCNVCFCASDGTARCTMAACDVADH